MHSVSSNSLTVSRTLGAVYSGASVGSFLLQGLALTCFTLYETNQHASEKPNLIQKYLVPFATFAGIGFFFGFSLPSILFTATALTAIKIGLVSSKIFKMGHSQQKSKPLEILTHTKTIDGFEENERYIELDISLPALKEISSSEAVAEIVFCVDKSGSMDGGRIEQVRNVLLGLLEKVAGEFKQGNTPDISLSVVVFESAPSLLLSKQKITKENIESLKKTISSLSTNGGTCIIEAIDAATSELTDRHNPKAAKNLVFLTDGQDNRFYEHQAQLSDFQKVWISNHTNLLAIGIGEDHDAGILEAIVTDKDSELFLPNAVYNYIPDGNASSSRGSSLENAVNLIYRQALGQAIFSMELSIEDRDVQVLNTQRNDSGQFLLGGLSYGQTTQKILRYRPSSERISGTIPYTISLNTREGTQAIKRNFSLSPQIPDQATQKATLIQALVPILKLIQQIASGKIALEDFFAEEGLAEELAKKKALDEEYRKIWNEKMGQPGCENYMKFVRTLIALDKEKWVPFFEGKASQKSEEKKRDYQKAREAKGNEIVERAQTMIEEWELSDDEDIQNLLKEIREANLEIANPNAPSKSAAKRLETTCHYATSRAYH